MGVMKCRNAKVEVFFPSMAYKIARIAHPSSPELSGKAEDKRLAASL